MPTEDDDYGLDEIDAEEGDPDDLLDEDTEAATLPAVYLCSSCGWSGTDPDFGSFEGGSDDDEAEPECPECGGPWVDEIDPPGDVDFADDDGD